VICLPRSLFSLESAEPLLSAGADGLLREAVERGQAAGANAALRHWARTRCILLHTAVFLRSSSVESCRDLPRMYQCTLPACDLPVCALTQPAGPFALPSLLPQQLLTYETALAACSCGRAQVLPSGGEAVAASAALTSTNGSELWERAGPAERRRGRGRGAGAPGPALRGAAVCHQRGRLRAVRRQPGVGAEPAPVRVHAGHEARAWAPHPSAPHSVWPPSAGEGAISDGSRGLACCANACAVLPARALAAGGCRAGGRLNCRVSFMMVLSSSA